MIAHQKRLDMLKLHLYFNETALTRIILLADLLKTNTVASFDNQSVSIVQC